MNNELEKILKRAWPNLRYYPGIFLERLKKTMTISKFVTGVGMRSFANATLPCLNIRM
jgi:hypothetical protein